MWKQAEDGTDASVRPHIRKHSTQVTDCESVRSFPRTALPPAGVSKHCTEVPQGGERRISDREEPPGLLAGLQSPLSKCPLTI